MPVAKGNQQRGLNAIVRGESVDQTIIGLFEIDEEFKHNSASYCNSMDKIYAWHKSDSEFRKEVPNQV